MDDYAFYQSFYERELKRRNELDSAVNIPLAAITLVSGLISYVISNNDFSKLQWDDTVVLIILGFATLLTTLGILFLIFSYNNFFRGFEYTNISLLGKIRHYQLNEIPDFNHQVSKKEDKVNFEFEIIKRIISYTDNHIEINDKRSLTLYWSKTFIILSVILTLLGVAFITLNNMVL